MPTYEYICSECKHHFEQFQNMNDPVLKTCPVCKKDELKRLIGSGAGIIFKGTGFYCTDYRSDNYNKAKNKAKKSLSTVSKTNTDKKTDPAVKATQSA